MNIDEQILNLLSEKYGINLLKEDTKWRIFDADTYLQMSVDIAILGALSGYGPFGAVLVEESNRIISYGYNKVVSENDSTQHAEIVAIREAQRLVHSHTLLRGSLNDEMNLYCSCRPCIQCMGAVWWSGIKNVYYFDVSDCAEDLGFSEGPREESFWRTFKDELDSQKNIKCFPIEDQDDYAEIPFQIYKKRNGVIY